MRKFFNYEDELRATLDGLENNRVHLIVVSEITNDLLLDVTVHESWAEHYLSSYLEMDADLVDHHDDDCPFSLDIGGSE